MRWRWFLLTMALAMRMCCGTNKEKGIKMSNVSDETIEHQGEVHNGRALQRELAQGEVQ
jgi:hypothetical protein